MSADPLPSFGLGGAAPGTTARVQGLPNLVKSSKYELLFAALGSTRPRQASFKVFDAAVSHLWL